jgi:uncharacterized protein YgbK (DUF1537 family)
MALLGCIGDDFTGSTDLANTLVRQGMRTIQTIGAPKSATNLSEADAVVVALKSRTIPAAEAVAQSLEALDFLKGIGCRQFFFKYCSTFDSTDDGNIGPVAEALLEALGSDLTIACPAFPENGRNVFKGHLFVGDELLSDSGMKDHPLTPMTDSNLVRVLRRQTSGGVGLVQYSTVRQGHEAIRKDFDRLRTEGDRFAVVDAITDDHLYDIGRACADLPLVTGGSGVALGLPENFRRRKVLSPHVQADQMPRINGKTAVLSGSCSRATREQVRNMAETHPAYAFDVAELANGDSEIEKAVDWALPRLESSPVLIYSTDEPERVRALQDKIGRDKAGELVERAQAAVARRLRQAGVRRFIVAGGETSGAVVNALGVEALKIGPQIDPGVPWTTSVEDEPLALALKSGNFGAPNFFTKALEMLG